MGGIKSRPRPNTSNNTTTSLVDRQQHYYHRQQRYCGRGVCGLNCDESRSNGFVLYMHDGRVGFTRIPVPQSVKNRYGKYIARIERGPWSGSLVGHFVKYKLVLPIDTAGSRKYLPGGSIVVNYQLVLYQSVQKSSDKIVLGYDVGDLAASYCSLCGKHVPHCRCEQVFFPSEYASYLKYL